jgi:hypothetical protein
MGARVGTSFSPRRCARFGIPVRSTFERVLELGFAPIRLSAYWDEIRRDGYGDLDRLVDAAQEAGRQVVLTAGVKAMQWPEFYLPPDVAPDPDRQGRIGRAARFAHEVTNFVAETVARYRDRPCIVCWQVENEPFNRSGPRRWWIDPRLVRREVAAVRVLDRRPIVLNAFAHFDPTTDADSRPRRGPLGLRRLSPEKAILALLRPTDVLGLDVYTAIVDRRAEPGWAEHAQRWLTGARRRACDAWVIECQAEPWEAPGGDYASPRSFTPDDLVSVHGRLVAAGFATILLWGCEYWLWRASAGDSRWLEAAERCRSFEP